MQVKFKTSANDVFTMDLDETETIESVKRKIRQEKGDDYPVEQQTLICKGKILTNSQTIVELQLDDKSFIALLLLKPKTAPVDQTVAGEQAAELTSDDQVPRGQPKPIEVSENVVEAPPVVASGHVAGGQHSPAINEEENLVNEITSMGFAESSVRQALRLSFNNAERAVEYLTTGFPDELLSSVEHASADVLTGHQGDLASLVNKPGFIRLRRAVQQNPDMLQELLAEMEATNPGWINIINENQQAFVDLLNAEEEEGEEYGVSELPVEQEDVAFERPMEESSDNRILLQQSDIEVIERLKAMGFTQTACVEAYIACDKNENLAANYLLQTLEEDEELSQARPPPSP